MKKCVLPLLGILLIGLATGSDSSKEYNEATELNDLEGSWRLVSIDLKGYTLRDKDVVFMFRGKSVTEKSIGRVVLYGIYKADPVQKPAHLDRTLSNYPFEGETTWKSIYRIDGDTLRIAGSANPSERPEGFDDKNGVIITLTRVKK